MIWYFLAGWIAGAVGVLMLGKWWVESHVEVVEKCNEANCNNEEEEIRDD